MTSPKPKPRGRKGGRKPGPPDQIKKVWPIRLTDAERAIIEPIVKAKLSEIRKPA